MNRNIHSHLLHKKSPCPITSLWLLSLVLLPSILQLVDSFVNEYRCLLLQLHTLKIKIQTRTFEIFCTFHQNSIKKWSKSLIEKESHYCPYMAIITDLFLQTRLYLLYKNKKIIMANIECKKF